MLCAQHSRPWGDLWLVLVTNRKTAQTWGEGRRSGNPCCLTLSETYCILFCANIKSYRWTWPSEGIWLLLFLFHGPALSLHPCSGLDLTRGSCLVMYEKVDAGKDKAADQDL